MHLHPTVGGMLIRAGLRHGLRSLRIPYEPPAPLRESDGTVDTKGAALLRLWTRLLRAQARRAGLTTNDWCFGLAWSGAMGAERVTRLAGCLPDGLSEIYFHPATARSSALRRLMPHYDHEGELRALRHPGLRAALSRGSVRLTTWQEQEAAGSGG